VTVLPKQNTFDGRAELRDVIHERLGFILLYAETGQRLCEAGDDAMLECTIRKLIAYTKTAGQDLIDLLRSDREGA
jgi:hypothetical protein